MNGFKVYQTYLALKRHFETDSYDYIKYQGKVKVSKEAYERRRDRIYFEKLAHERDPEELLIANFIFNPEMKWIGAVDPECRLIYKKYDDNGFYFFKADVEKLHKDFNANFTIDKDNPIPYILLLYRAGEITLYTLCVMETLLSCTDKWKTEPSSILFREEMRKIKKTAPFFPIATDKYKRLLLQSF